MRVLVTGGAGFIGSHLADRFVADGHTVLVIDDLSSGVRTQVPEAARFVQADIRSEEAKAAVLAFAPHIVCHQAAQMDVRRSVAEPAFDAAVNVVGLVNIVESARIAGALEHVLFASSGGAMYGEQDVFPAPESHPRRPESPYGLTKGIGEDYLDWYHRTYGITYAAMRYGNVYGPRQNPHGEAGVIAIFTSRFLAGQDVTVFGTGAQTRDYVFVKDVVEANMAALEARAVGGWNVARGEETDVNALASTLHELCGANGSIHHAPARAGEQQRSVIDPSALRDKTGFEPTTTIRDGLAETVAWFKARADG